MKVRNGAGKLKLMGVWCGSEIHNWNMGNFVIVGGEIFKTIS